MCRLSVVCESVQGKRKQALFALQWLVSFCLRRCRSTNQLTNTHKYTLCCRRLPSASGWLTPADLTREPESVCSVPACTLTRMNIKHTYTLLLPSQDHSLVWLWFFFSHPVTSLVLTRQCHLHDHRQTWVSHRIVTPRCSVHLFCHMKSGRKGNRCVANESSVVSVSRWITDRVGLRAVNCLAPSHSLAQLTLHGMNMAKHPVSHSLSVCCSATAFPSAAPFLFFICKTAVFEIVFLYLAYLRSVWFNFQVLGNEVEILACILR